MASEAPVIWRVDGRGIATVTLNRPERNNAYNDELIAGLHAALDALSHSADLRAVVINGNGRHFQAGADLEWLSAVRRQDLAANQKASRDTAEAVNRLNHVPVPTLALVKGACVGGGTGLLAACDVVLAAEKAIFAISEVRWGLTAAVIVPQLVDAIGVRQLRRYGLTGERFSAHEAQRTGLVHEVVADDELDARGEAIVTAILDNAPDAIAQTKQTTLRYACGDMSPTELNGLVVEHGAKRRSCEAEDGLASFQEQRPARWAPGAS